MKLPQGQMDKMSRRLARAMGRDDEEHEHEQHVEQGNQDEEDGDEML